MGDMADMILEQQEDSEIAPKPEDYLEMSDQEIVNASAFARSNKLKGIRQWHLAGNKLTEKQRWCLAFALCERDRKWA